VHLRRPEEAPGSAEKHPPPRVNVLFTVQQPFQPMQLQEKSSRDQPARLVQASLKIPTCRASAIPDDKGRNKSSSSSCGFCHRP
jgi:hypothetical protein